MVVTHIYSLGSLEVKGQYLVLTEHYECGASMSGGVRDGDEVDDPRGEIECDVVRPLDHGHRVMLVLLLRGDSPCKHQQRVLVRVQPLDLGYGHTAAIARICTSKNMNNGKCSVVTTFTIQLLYM